MTDKMPDEIWAGKLGVDYYGDWNAEESIGKPIKYIRADLNNWQPIETAPTSGRVALWMWNKNYETPQECFSNTWWTSGFSHGLKPTHWMYCKAPQLPKGEEK